MIIANTLLFLTFPIEHIHSSLISIRASFKWQDESYTSDKSLEISYFI